MFSRRASWDLQPNALAARLAQREHAPLDLTEGNPTRCGLGLDAAALRDALGAHGVERYDPHPQGLLRAREAVAAYYAERGVRVSADALFLTASTSEAYSWLFKLLCDDGDTVLVPRPGYPLFEYLAGLEGVRVEHYPMRFDGDWWLDLAAIRARFAQHGPRVRALVVVNPGNPTGAFLSHDEARELAALCSEHDAAIVSDEVFADYAHAPDERRIESLAAIDAALTFSMSGFSKVLAMPQLKLGWIHVSGPAALAQPARQRLDVIADTFLSVGAQVQLAAPALLAHRRPIQQRILERVRANLDTLRTALAPLHATRVLPVEGGWYAVVRVPSILTDEEWSLDLLDHAGVLVQPGYFFDFDTPGHLVVSLLPEPATFDEGATRLAARVQTRT